MATFFVLPPRPFIQTALESFLESWFPGLNHAAAAWPEVGDVFDTALAGEASTYVIYRDELAEDGGVERGLRDRFGAEAGDQVIEVRGSPCNGEVRTRTWQLRPEPALRLAVPAGV